MAGLTVEMKAAVEESWGIIRAKPLKYGPEFFYTFFTMFPDYQNLFKDFKGVPLDQLKTNTKVRTHGTRVVYAINSMVDALEDLPVAAGIMQKTVEDHYPRGIRKQHFTDLFVALFKFLIEHAHLNDTAVEGWTIVRDTLMGVAEATLATLDK